MCGICGIAKTDNGEPVSRSLLSSMCATIVHRGPDDEGIFVQNNVGLGVRRLSIIDVEGGHQPLSNEDGSVWVAHNGEIYNFPELREELITCGHTFKTRTDTETIVHSYEEWGEHCFQKFRGMFAFALWDDRTKRLLVGRDRMGIKPFYYTLIENKERTLVFGSELKTILVHPDVKRALEPQALDLYLTFEYIPEPLSAFQNIYKLPAGTFLIYERGKIHIERYWDVNREQEEEVSTKPHGISLASIEDELYERLKESVKARLLSDVPLGAFLSGGIDSSAIVGLMHELGVSPIKTFSIGFEDATYNELEHARRISQKFHTDHEEFILKPQALELTEKLIRHLDEPFGDFSIFPTYLVSKMARSHVKVILSGDGGDELFAGYEHYQAQKLSRLPLVSFLSKPMPAVLRKLPPSSKKKGLWNKLRRYAQGFEHPQDLRHFRWMMFLNQKEREDLYSKDFRHELEGIKPFHTIPPLDKLYPQLDRFDDINGELYLDLRSYLVDDILVKVDRMSMATSLETRVPLIDHKVVEYVFQIPGHLKLKGMTTKWIFKKTMERLLPPQNIYRSKEGFSIPIKHWLRNELKELMLHYLSESRIRDAGLFNFGPIKHKIDRHMQGRENYSHQLWALLVFEIWRENFLKS
ncbi:MAG: asparagine synthase (glutamine-hydrolyzing) [Candidatus Aminicenantes bacterium]|nr:asparagine synthase (glutamine-hydrolyzing) [Candidatus Aminicenantes bacterium]